MINIIVQYYRVNYPNIDKEVINKRQHEIDYCFINNITNYYVDKVHFLYEKKEDLDYLFKRLSSCKKNSKLITVDISKRINYQDVFRYAKTYDETHNINDNIWIYLHGNMKVNHGLEKLKSSKLLNSKCIFTLASHTFECNNRFKCLCNRQYKTEKGIYTPTCDGLIFKSNITDEVINKLDHIVHCLGAENRLIFILRQHGYDVVSPNKLVKCVHVHLVKIFANEHQLWIDKEGKFHKKKVFSNIHEKQKNLPFEKKIVGGGIPFFQGCSRLVEEI